MDRRRNGRGGPHASTKQKLKLISLMAKHPKLVSGKITTDFSYIHRQRLWQVISDECNALPGAKKHWSQWRKTWQDLRSKYKKQYKGVSENKLPPILAQLSAKEKESLGIKTIPASELKEESEGQKETEFVQIEPEGTKDNNFDFEGEMAPEYSEPESPPERKVFSRPRKSTAVKIKNRRSSKHSDNCAFNCDLLAVNEQRKLEMKQDYITFKKDYLRQKLKLIKEQTEALKTIARELSDK